MVSPGRTAPSPDRDRPEGKKIQDKFSLSGFSAAYKAIAKACP